MVLRAPFLYALLGIEVGKQIFTYLTGQLTPQFTKLLLEGDSEEFWAVVTRGIGLLGFSGLEANKVFILS